MMKEGNLEHWEGKKNNGKNRNMDAEKLDHSYIAGENKKWYSLFGKQEIYYKTNMLLPQTQQLHSWHS